MNQWDYSPEEIEILDERAQMIAIELEIKKKRSEFAQVAVVTVGNEKFGVPVKSLIEVVKTPSITVLPDLPEWILGIVQVRGELISVVDLAKWFRISVVERSNFVAIVQGPPGRLGLQIEDIVNFRTVYKDEVVQTLHVGEAKTGRPIHATTIDLLTLLDTRRLFESPHIIIGGSGLQGE